ncbi:hypothetical protein [Amazonocrinis nigriterrae]|uniref:hypothetical protein n=1 Tax=Amazonocrinis nigriterrae TaxID=2840443 RepID=UPI001BE445F4|nr:hypothetical protein [Amazonocrinis nigriterrae]
MKLYWLLTQQYHASFDCDPRRSYVANATLTPQKHLQHSALSTQHCFAESLLIH